MNKPGMKKVDEAMLRFLNEDITQMQKLAVKYATEGNEDKVHEILRRLEAAIHTRVNRPNTYNS